MEFTYDLAGNKLTQVTANLRAEHKAITYEYNYNRLEAIHYPDNAANDVKYIYGEAGAAGNRAGRLVRQEDATGAPARKQIFEKAF